MVKLTCVVHQEGDVAVHPCSEPSDVKYDIHSGIEVTGSEVTHSTGVEGEGASQQGRHAAEDVFRTAAVAMMEFIKHEKEFVHGDEKEGLVETTGQTERERREEREERERRERGRKGWFLSLVLPAVQFVHKKSVR